jgi:hypothetical protein
MVQSEGNPLFFVPESTKFLMPRVSPWWPILPGLKVTGLA